MVTNVIRITNVIKAMVTNVISLDYSADSFFAAFPSVIKSFFESCKWCTSGSGSVRRPRTDFVRKYDIGIN